MTEPGAGSDAANIKTTAAKVGDNFVINGTKQFITNGDRAETFVVFASNDPTLGAFGGITAFIVERSFGGVSTAKVEKKMGIRASTTAQLVFQDCPVPKENILGTFRCGVPSCSYRFGWRPGVSFGWRGRGLRAGSGNDDRLGSRTSEIGVHAIDPVDDCGHCNRRACFSSDELRVP